MSALLAILANVNASAATGEVDHRSRIDAAQAALATGTTCTQIVERDLQAIADLGLHNGLNAVTAVPRAEALRAAKAVDERLRQGEPMRPLECTTVGVKDNIDVGGMATTAGSVALAGNIATADAPVVSRLKADGAIVIARTNMAEWAFSPRHTISSTAGETLNATDQALVPAGSSGGSAAGVAAGLFAISLGTDTGNSIRGPAAHNGLVGLRPSIGLVPIDRIVPLLAQVDVAGPIVATVRDAALVLDSLVQAPGRYSAHLDSISLRGRRIAMVMDGLTQGGVDPQVAERLVETVRDMERAGAVIVEVESAAILAQLGEFEPCISFRADVRAYFRDRGGFFAHYDPIFAYTAGLFAPQSGEPFQYFAADRNNRADCPVYSSDETRLAARSRIEALLDELDVAAIAYPTWSAPPAPRTRWSEEYRGDNSQVLVPVTGLPAISVPMGALRSGAPIGLQFVGHFLGERDLLALAHSFERMMHR